ncbi:MAG: CotH kinase family protein [Paludibacteraceae bacterium]
MKSRFFILLMALLSYFPARASILINELMPRNVSYMINENFNFDGWVEVYNSGAENYNLANCTFSDGDVTWQSGVDSILAPGKYAIFYFNETDINIHASFKLDSDGGTLTLSDKNGTQLDQINYPKPIRNTSYGRSTDGGSSLGFLSFPTPGLTNNTSSVMTEQAGPPVFSLAPGFYSTGQTLSITAPSVQAMIYYTTDGSEPKATEELQYTGPVSLEKNTPIRAIAVEAGKLPSDITTASYFIGNRKVTLPVVSLVTEPKMFYDDTIGMLVVGVSGTTEIPNYCSFNEEYANFQEDWDRPCNFELFDDDKAERLNMEVKAGNFGACSRTKFTKSIKINASKAYGGNKMDYTIFKEKPNLKWKSVVLRNSGNDFGRSYLRDGFMQSLLIGQMDIDHQAYQPSVVYINGKYYGLLNIRERSNSDFIYSNYGLDEDEVYIESSSSSTSYSDTEGYKEILEMLTEDLTTDEAFKKIDSLIDVDEFLNYFMSQIYFANSDWAGGNLKAWKRIINGKWRWILYDTDFGFSCYGDNYSSNGFANASKNVAFKGFIQNPTIKEKLMTKFVIHLATTFQPDRVVHILDSISSYIKDEALIYREYLVDNGKVEAVWNTDIDNMKEFAEERPDYVYNHLGTFLKLGDTTRLHIYAEEKGTQFLLNGEKINLSDFIGYYYAGSDIRVKAIAPNGYKFDHWEIQKKKNIINQMDSWSYYDEGSLDAEAWASSSYNDASWKTGEAPLGFGFSGFINTTVNKKSSKGINNLTTYYRKTMNIADISSINKLVFSATVNDGAIIYLNGNEIFRYNLPATKITFDTKATSYMSKYKRVDFEVSKMLLKEGDNTIAVEIHNSAATNSTMAFALTVHDPDNGKDISTSNNTSYSENFARETAYKAIFTEDTEWEDKCSKLYLNEVCVTNKQYVDEFMEDEDWIEIYNDGSEDIDLGGMFLSDERKDLRKYQIADSMPAQTTVPAKGYLIFWADSQPEQGILHTNFSLPLTREQTVSLSKVVNGEIFVIDSIRYSPHEKGESYARFAYDMGGDWRITSRPTFKAENEYVTRVGVETIESDGINIAVYPNPTTDILWFSLPWEEKANVQIMNGIRTTIQTEIADKEGIEVGHLASGFYFAIVTNSTTGEKQIIKFIKR